MNQFIMMILIINALIFTQMNHPMSMGLILLLQTFLTCMMMGNMSKNFWFSYILFLVIIGGMLILFIYMASLASNEKFYFSLNSFLILIFIYLMFFFYWLVDKFLSSSIYTNNEMNLMNKFFNLTKENFLSISKMYDCPNNFIIMFLIIYLLLNLIIIVKITHILNGPLRTKNL